MKLFRTTSLFLAFLFVWGSIACAANNMDEMPKGVWVTGNAIIEKEPDQTVIVFSIVTTGKTPLSAQNENAQISSKISERFLGEGLDGNQWKTVSMNMSPQSGSKGYQMFHQISLTLYDINQAGRIVNILVDHGVDRIDSIVFGLKDPKAAEYEAIAQATQNAKKKGEIIARAAGATVTGISFIGPSQAVYQPRMYANKSMADLSASAERAEQHVWASTIEVAAEIQICLDLAE